MLLEQISIHAWISNNKIKTENGEPIDFYNHRYLFDIYSDRSDFICSMKAGQIGFTTYEILKTAHEAKNEGIDIIYVLPTADDVKQFSGGKTNRIIDNNPDMQKWTRDKDSVEQKRFGNATIYYRGSWTERTAIMISAKKVVVDEFDKCKQAIVAQYDSRLQHASKPKKAYFSNPALPPETGIHKYYLLSDQKAWNVTHSCGKRFIMDESCVDYKQEKYICPSCKGEISDEERRMGEWYDKDDKKWSGQVEGYDWSGWWVPLWINPMFSAKKIAEYKRDKTPEYFHTFVSALPYVNPNDQLTKKALQNCLSPYTNPQSARMIIGLDTGHDLHYTLINKDGVFFHGYCPSIAENPTPNYDPYDEIDRLMRENSNAILVADQGGDLIGIRKLEAKYKGRVFLCWFVKETKNKELIRWGEDEEYGKVLVDRNRVMQLTVDQINDRRMVFNGSVEEWEPFFKQCLNIYRQKEIVDDNEPTYGWRWVWKRKGPDHFFLSLVYAMVGLDRFAQDLATIIRPTDIMKGIPVGSDKSGVIVGRRFINKDLLGGTVSDF